MAYEDFAGWWRNAILHNHASAVLTARASRRKVTPPIRRAVSADAVLIVIISKFQFDNLAWEITLCLTFRFFFSGQCLGITGRLKPWCVSVLLLSLCMCDAFLYLTPHSLRCHFQAFFLMTKMQKIGRPKQTTFIAYDCEYNFRYSRSMMDDWCGAARSGS